MLSWSILGGFFVLYLLGLVGVLLQPGEGGVDGLLMCIAIMAVCSLACANCAYRSYRMIGLPGSATDSDLERMQSEALRADVPSE